MKIRPADPGAFKQIIQKGDPMKNYVQEGKSITVIGPTGGVTSGQGFMIGELSLVASVDIAEGASGSARTQDVFDLAVKGADGTGNAAIAFGDKVYLDGAELNADDANGKFYGHALGAVVSGETTTIPVRLSN